MWRFTERSACPGPAPEEGASRPPDKPQSTFGRLPALRPAADTSPLESPSHTSPQQHLEASSVRLRVPVSFLVGSVGHVWGASSHVGTRHPACIPAEQQGRCLQGLTVSSQHGPLPPGGREEPGGVGVCVGGGAESESVGVESSAPPDKGALPSDHGPRLRADQKARGPREWRALNREPVPLITETA